LTRHPPLQSDALPISLDDPHGAGLEGPAILPADLFSDVCGECLA
jgi:hypothetical protein